MERVDAVVIGAGVVGLAAARELARTGREVIVLEAENAIGTQTSSRNSEVIHAGIYYPNGSLKAQMCVRGRQLLYAFCDEFSVAAKPCGKLIVATDDAQVERLGSIEQHARGNGVDNLRLLSAEQALAMEPALACVAALHSPSTGIVDSHGFMLAIQGDAEAHGAMIAFCSRLESVHCGRDVITLSVSDISDPAHPETTDIHTGLLINAAGHGAVGIANAIEGIEREQPWRGVFTKGNYFRLAGRAPFSRLIYPVPEPGGLGVHLTLDLGGQARFGPDVEVTERFDYAVDPTRADSFYGAIRRYWPELPDDALLPDYSGFRPKLGDDARGSPDFAIEDSGPVGASRVFNLLGIESPGLTASLAIAERVHQHLGAE